MRPSGLSATGLKRWLTIERAIGSVDLRPYVFVARDKRLLTGTAGSGGLEALTTKLCGSQLEIRAAEPEVKVLTPGRCRYRLRNLA